MKEELLIEKIKSLSRVFLRPDHESPVLNEVVRAAAEIFEAVVLVVDREGGLLALETIRGEYDSDFEKIRIEGSLENNPGLHHLSRSNKTLIDEANEYNFVAVPIISGGKRFATFLIGRKEGPFEKGYAVLAEVAATFFGMLLLQAAAEKEDQDARDRELAEGAFESLSYSEVEAIREILRNLKNNENVVVASKIADNLGITRSVIVNALRKFESAGIIESRSLGMKGTFIRVKNLHALEIVASRSEKISYFR